MKTIKIDNQIHKELLQIKILKNYKTLSDTIKMCLEELGYKRYGLPVRIKRKVIKYDQSKK